jgi:hypothetical protein
MSHLMAESPARAAGIYLWVSCAIMRQARPISIEVSAADRERLAAVVTYRNSPQKQVWRAWLILATTEGSGALEIMRRAWGF